jgi:hypothetical protein
VFLLHGALDTVRFVSAVKKKSNFVYKFDIMTVRVCLLSMCAMICTVNLVRIACCILLCTHVSKCFTSACHCLIQSIHILLQINQPTRRNSFTDLLLDVYVWLNMFRAPPRPSSRAYNCISSLWFYRWNVVVATLLVVVLPPARHDQQRCYHHAPTVKPEAANEVVSSW